MCDDDHSPWRGCKRLYDETEINGGAQMLNRRFGLKVHEYISVQLVPKYKR